MKMDHVGGYAGKYLRVDLTAGTLADERWDEANLRKYIGGTGFGAKVIYDEVPPEVTWSDPENRITLASGPLGGTSVSGSGTFSVVTKGALTNSATSTQANGYLGAFMKFAGYDGVIVHGRAKEWKYLYLHDGVAELRDASALVGKDTWETEDLIKAGLGYREHGMSVFGIGPAGENLVKFAAIIGDKGHAAAHNGVGAVLGSKKLKAIAAARGKGSVEVVDRAHLRDLARQNVEMIRADKASMSIYTWGTLEILTHNEKTGTIPVKNYTTNVYEIGKDDLEKYGAQYIRSHFEPQPNPCWACPAHHCHILRIPDGPYAGFVGEEPEYECFAAWGPLTGVTDVAASIVLSNEVDRLGFDTNEAGYVIALALECYQKGLISKKDTDGIELTWGNVPAIRAMLQKMALREGFGDLLAEGVMRAARQIGGDAPNFAVHTMKGGAPRGHDHRSQWWEMFDTSMSDTGTIETARRVDPKMFGLPPLSHNFAAEEIARMIAVARGAMPFEDSLGVCRFNSWFDLPALAEFLQAATGWDFTFDEANRAGLRFANLLRAFNIRHGLTPDIEAPSPRYGSTPVDGPAKGKSIQPEWAKMKDIYYREMGWDPQSGRPLPETLKALGLGDLVLDLWPVSEPVVG
ncbi:MAG: hypothetical protein HYX92_13355 [Chloroflexi bacterium]|nr:hypothetical protein [Chloroflexota bacterium]